MLCRHPLITIFYCDEGLLQTSGNGGYRSIFVSRSWKLCIRCRFISRLVPYLLMLLCLLQKVVEYWYVFKCFEVMFRLQIKVGK